MIDGLEEAGRPLEYTLELDPPVSIKQGQSVDRIVLHEPTAGQLRKARFHYRGGINMESVSKYEITLIAGVAGQPEAVIEAVPVSKINEAMEYLNFFIEPGPPIGKS